VSYKFYLSFNWKLINWGLCHKRIIKPRWSNITHLDFINMYYSKCWCLFVCIWIFRWTLWLFCLLSFTLFSTFIRSRLRLQTDHDQSMNIRAKVGLIYFRVRMDLRAFSYFRVNKSGKIHSFGEAQMVIHVVLPIIEILSNLFYECS